MIRGSNLAFKIGSAVFAAIVLIAFIVPLISTVDPNRNNLRAISQPPLSPDHLLGTDSLGRDMLIRLIHGARISLLIGGAGMLIAMVVGVTVGMVAGFLGGWVDGVLMRLVDIQLAFPFILLALTLVTAIRPSVPTLILLLSLAAWVLFARTIRSAVLKEINREYVQAALVLGASRSRIALRYVLPNLVPTIAVLAILELAALILFESTLSFLGVGIQAPTPSWGSMMLEGQSYIRGAWWITTLPGISLFITTLSLNLMSEGLRNVLDPRLQR